MAPRADVPEKITALGVIAPPPIHVTTPTFDGSLGTLFAFVRDHKVDLLDIPLFPICEAYFTYLLNSPEKNLDEAAAALAALAYLLERKAFLLLPVPEPEPDEWEEPLELECTHAAEYAAAIDVLQTWQEERAALFFRSPDSGNLPYELPYELANVAPSDLARAFDRLMRRALPDEMPDLSRPKPSLRDQMLKVSARLTDEWRSIDELFEEPITRSEAVFWFLALLELIRLGRCVVRVVDEEVGFARAGSPVAKVILNDA